MRFLVIDRRLKNWAELEKAKSDAERMFKIWAWKARLSKDFPLIVTILGGTGTGKSTLFNSLVGQYISEVGTRRPMTRQPVIFSPQQVTDAMKSCPLLAGAEDTQSLSSDCQPIIKVHHEPSWAPAILIDAPDFDSIEQENQVVAENLFFVSDIVLFVTSQEKYGDMVFHLMVERGVQWGKKMVFVMNKLSSDSAYQDFMASLRALGYHDSALRIDRLDGLPPLIPGLKDRAEFSALFSSPSGDRSIRTLELEHLRDHTAKGIAVLEALLTREMERIQAAVARIQEFVHSISAEMEAQGSRFLPSGFEEQVRERLRQVLKKYDVLATPRALIRNVLGKLWSAVVNVLNPPDPRVPDHQERPTKELAELKARAQLAPLESAVAALHQRIAEMLTSEPGWDDLRQWTWSDVPRWDTHTLRELYAKEFPGVEEFLDQEFERLQEGLSPSERARLYGSYTLWTLLLITCEVAVGGGFSFFDAILDTVIVPFIPELVLSAHIRDRLRDIGARVDKQHRKALQTVLDRQAEQYETCWKRLIPPQDELERLRKLKRDVAEGKYYPQK